MLRCSLWIRIGLPTIDWEMLIYDPWALRIEFVDRLDNPGTSHVSQEKTNPGSFTPDKDWLNTDTDMPDAADDNGYLTQSSDTGELFV